MSNQLEIPVVLASKTIDGIEMGVLKDGTAYLTGRSLARLCGVSFSSVIEQKDNWAAGERDGKLARLLTSIGYSDTKLAYPVAHKGTGVGAEALAYPEQVVMAFLEHYAFELQKPEALANYRILGRAGFKLFVYGALGYDPDRRLPPTWRHYHDRLLENPTPLGYFSVLKEGAEFVIHAISNGLQITEATVPDISVGKTWGSHWEKQKLSERFGDRFKWDHNYPDYMPQADSNPQQAWIYPLSALGEFRTWLQTTYVPEKFPAYLDGKVKRGMLPASTKELILAAMVSPEIPALPPKP